MGAADAGLARPGDPGLLGETERYGGQRFLQLHVGGGSAAAVQVYSVGVEYGTKSNLACAESSKTVERGDGGAQSRSVADLVVFLTRVAGKNVLETLEPGRS